MKRETVQSVTRWATESFGPCSLETAYFRARDEWDELAKCFDQEKTLNSLEIAEEAADVVICLYRLIGMTFPGAIEMKMGTNRKRKWKVDGSGCAQHIEES